VNRPPCSSPRENLETLPARLPCEAERPLVLAKRGWLISALYLGSSGIGVASFVIIGIDSRVLQVSIIFSALVLSLWVGSMLRLRRRQKPEKVVAFAVGFACAAFVGGLFSLLFGMFSVNTPRFMVLLLVWSCWWGTYRSTRTPSRLRLRAGAEEGSSTEPTGGN